MGEAGWIAAAPAVLAGLYGFGVLVAMLAISRRRGFAGTLAWVLAILFLPVVGAAAYLLLANPRVEKTRMLKRRARARSLEARAARSPLPASEGAGDLAPLHRRLLVLARRLSGLPPTRGNRLELLTDNADAFARIEAALGAARRYAWAEYYIVRHDDTGRRFLDLLAAAARRGVDVRLLYDAVGSSRIDRGRLAALHTAGGRAEPFLPVNPLRRRWAVHLRNHRKVLVVDGEVGYTGGMNVGDEYSGSGRRRRKRPWRDTHLELRGPAVDQLAQVFAEDWCFATDICAVPPESTAPWREGGGTVAVLPSGPDQEFNAHGLVYCAGIGVAASRCYLTSPYFVPDEPTLQALITAALRGVDVRLLVPARSDIPLMRLAIRSFYPRLAGAGVRVYEYQPRMLHAKTMVVDGEWGVVGSANVDMRSFGLNFEIGALVFDRDFASTLEARFREDLAASAEVARRAVASRGFLAAVSEGAAQLLSPLL